MVEIDNTKEILRNSREIITLIGPEGVGKTEIAKRLSTDSGKPIVSTGDTIRNLAANDPGELGDACREMFANKTYLAGDLLLKIMFERFRQSDTEKGFIYDGGMRTLDEVLGLPAVLISANRNQHLSVVYLEIPEEETYKRLVSGESARKRNDDTPEKIASRLAAFNFQLAERLEAIENQSNWSLIKIDGNLPKDIVYGNVCSEICGRLHS